MKSKIRLLFVSLAVSFSSWMISGCSEKLNDDVSNGVVENTVPKAVLSVDLSCNDGGTVDSKGLEVQVGEDLYPKVVLTDGKLDVRCVFKNVTKDCVFYGDVTFIEETPGKLHYKGDIDAEFPDGLEDIDAGDEVYVMCVAGSWQEEDPETRTIVFSANNITGHSGDNLGITSPYISGWHKLVASKQNDLVMNSGDKIMLKPKGIIMRFDMTNNTDYDFMYPQMSLTSNVLALGVRYDLSKANLPEIGGSDTELKWEDYTPSSMFMDMPVAGISSNVIAKEKVLVVQRKRENATTPNTSTVDNQKLYLWIMPKATQPTSMTDPTLKNVENPMTRIAFDVEFTPEMANTYVPADDKEFDKKMFDGGQYRKKAAPKFGWTLLKASNSRFVGADNKPLHGRVVNVKCTVESRLPMPIEYMAQGNVTSNTKTFSGMGAAVDTVDNNGPVAGPDRVSWQDISKEGTVSNTVLMKTYAPGGTETTPSWHVPSYKEWFGVLAAGKLWDGAGDIPTGSIAFNTELTEEIMCAGKTYSALTSIYDKPNGGAGTYIFAVKGLKKEGSSLKATPVSAAYMYDTKVYRSLGTGTTAFHIAAIPISQHQIDAVYGDLNALMTDVQKHYFWGNAGYANKIVKRTINSVKPNNGGYGLTAGYGYYWCKEADKSQSGGSTRVVEINTATDKYWVDPTHTTERPVPGWTGSLTAFGLRLFRNTDSLWNN